MRAPLCLLLACAASITIEAGSGKVLTVPIAEGVTMEFVRVEPGTFTMGSEEGAGEEDEMPLRQVTISRPFYLGRFEVTQRQWEAVMGSNPSHFKGEKLPVETVSWNDCQLFLHRLAQRTGRRFALPTEAQWEYACRAGTRSRWSFGDDESAIGDYAWFKENSGGTTHPVGAKTPNSWGLYDMHGNVGEWTADGYVKHVHARGSVVDPHEPVSAAHPPVWRGGAWGDGPGFLRSGARNVNGADGAHWGIGFRCALTPADDGPPADRDAGAVQTSPD